MRILIVTPAPPGSRKGNRISAARWVGILRALEHCVSVVTEYTGQTCDLMIALHAVRSHRSIVRCRRKATHTPIVLALTGTDIYGSIQRSHKAQESLALCDRFVVLQPLAIEQLPARYRQKTHVIYQSVVAPPIDRGPKSKYFDVCVVGHLRSVKDPFRTAMAVRKLSASSRIRVLHFGAALSESMEHRARTEEQRNPRYRWMGNRPRASVLRAIGRCRLCVLSSRSEGGANVIGESVVVRTPLLASRIPGTVGLLGEDYPGYFPVGNTGDLTDLLTRAECDSVFLEALRTACDQHRGLFAQGRERQAWARLLCELR